MYRLTSTHSRSTARGLHSNAPAFAGYIIHCMLIEAQAREAKQKARYATIAPIDVTAV